MEVSKLIKSPFDELFDPYKVSKCDFLLDSLRRVSDKYKENYTLLAICPNSEAVIRASVLSAKENNSPLFFAATLNQIDSDGGYTGLNFKQFVKKVRSEVKSNNYMGSVIIGLDHGGPWLKDKQSIENWSLHKCMQSIKKSFEEALLAGYDLIHVDPTVDRTLPPSKVISIEVVVNRIIELISHIKSFRRARSLPKISYEVGTEEVHGGLANMDTFGKFLKLLKIKLKNRGLEDIWPCFVVGKVGTDLHTTFFDRKVAQRLVFEASKYGSFVKGHYTDYVENPGDYPESGMGGANLGPELTEVELETLIKLTNNIEKKLFTKNKIKNISNIIKVISKAVEDSGRWKKWLNENEKSLEFNELSTERRDWLVKTGARYIWTSPKVVSARKILKSNLSRDNIDSEKIVISEIAKRIDKYINAFNLIGLNSKLVKELKDNSIKF